jgi:hypothetical protein
LADQRIDEFSPFPVRSLRRALRLDGRPGVVNGQGDESRAGFGESFALSLRHGSRRLRRLTETKVAYRTDAKTLRHGQVFVLEEGRQAAGLPGAYQIVKDSSMY